jgi:hypothetical protein
MIIEINRTTPGVVQTPQSNQIVKLFFDETTGLLSFKLSTGEIRRIVGSPIVVGNIDCRANPEYPAAKVSESYKVTGEGKIGGNDGVQVSVNDIITCIAENDGGTQAEVGTSWFVTQGNLVKATSDETYEGLDDEKYVTPLSFRTNFIDFSKLDYHVRAKRIALALVEGNNVLTHNLGANAKVISLHSNDNDVTPLDFDWVITNENSITIDVPIGAGGVAGAIHHILYIVPPVK